MKRGQDRRTIDLFSWEPPSVVRSFDAAKVRAASLRAAMSKAVALALKESGKSRDQAAEEISAYLGEDCPKAALDAYSSEAREDHTINVIRFMGLLHVTRDIRLLNLLAEQFGWAVIPTKYLPAIEEAVLADKIEELQQRKNQARRTWKGGV